MENNNSEDCGELILAGWHLKKEVNFSHMISVVLVLFSSLMWIIETKTNNLEQMLVAEDRRIEEKTNIIMAGMDRRFSSYQMDTNKILGRIERKQDKTFDLLNQKADK